jgi:hypothetical protein
MFGGCCVVGAVGYRYRYNKRKMTCAYYRQRGLKVFLTETPEKSSSVSSEWTNLAV